jgi:hypothetical protein
VTASVAVINCSEFRASGRAAWRREWPGRGAAHPRGNGYRHTRIGCTGRGGQVTHGGQGGSRCDMDRDPTLARVRLSHDCCTRCFGRTVESVKRSPWITLYETIMRRSICVSSSPWLKARKVMLVDVRADAHQAVKPPLDQTDDVFHAHSRSTPRSSSAKTANTPMISTVKISRTPVGRRAASRRRIDPRWL